MRGDNYGWSPRLDELEWVTKYSIPDGISYRVLEDALAQVPTQFLDCVAYIYPDAAAEKRGEDGGTAFVVEIPIGYLNWCQSYIVTAAHILGPDEVGSNPVVRVNLMEGRSVPIPTESNLWKIDPVNDIAIYPIDLDRSTFRYVVIPVGMFLTKENIEVNKFGPGNDVFVVGRLAQHEGTTRNLPSVRFGNISMMPGEPFKRTLKPDIPEVFFVEFRSIGGYSGSPAFLCEPPFHLYNRTAHVQNLSLGPHLLGLDLGHIRTKEPLLEKKVTRGGKVFYEEVNGKFYETNTAIATIVPAWQILALLDREDVAMRRQKDSNDLREKESVDDLALDSIGGGRIEPFTAEQFEADLRKVTRRVGTSEPDEETK